MDYFQMTAPCGLDCFNCHFYLALENKDARAAVQNQRRLKFAKLTLQNHGHYPTNDFTVSFISKNITKQINSDVNSALHLQRYTRKFKQLCLVNILKLETTAYLLCQQSISDDAPKNLISSYWAYIKSNSKSKKRCL